ncbi:FAD-binding oxidoreductase [Compostimonas suwonensis]|uniref:Glycolate oxidase n=1 Tax=Compostimonas suwonensis TaxID=1048394 RepID=A0A2M9BTX3_9MICO|nr:FAD-linked oxidase C-terminal domain-containing protein [Compostimonas suwonensis]PJJ61399.1 glycolate oxidase [Compostimonas suwonensis]
MDPNIVAELRAALGDAVIVDPARLQAIRTDRSGWWSSSAPLVLVEARGVAEVQAVMRIATRHRVGVIPRGAGTGLAGGAAGRDGAIVLSVASMNRILELSPDDELAVVEPGVLNDELSTAAREHGLFFAPDPASKAISSIGGNIATNAGGLLCAKYGVTREAVLGLTVVLPDGELLRTGHRTVKGVTGYDLTALLVGSEGTLGVVVEATVRLLPIAPGGTATVAAFFEDVAAAARAAAAITASRLRPAVMEIIDASALAAIRAYLGPAAFEGLPLPSPGQAFLLVQSDGRDARLAAEAIAEVVRAEGVEPQISLDERTGERLLAVRRAFHAALAARGEVLIEDVCVPRSRMREMFEAIDGIARRYGVEIPTVAHAGDGNLHPNFVIPGVPVGAALEPGFAVPDAIWSAADELFHAALALGGTLTGEHGVGVLKNRWLGEELGTTSLELQRRLKAVFDPLGIMNPGAVFR